MKTTAELRRLFDEAVARTGNPEMALQAVYDSGRMDSVLRQSTLPRVEARPSGTVIDISREVVAIRNAVVARYGLTVRSLLGGGRTMRQARAKGEMGWLLRNAFGMSLGEVAKHCGWADHTSVMYALGVVNKRINQFPDYRDELMAMVPAGVSVERTAA